MKRLTYLIDIDLLFIIPQISNQIQGAIFSEVFHNWYMLAYDLHSRDNFKLMISKQS